ncbi:hypothetical protein HCY78_08745 [Limosilactobacillus fermentum]
MEAQLKECREQFKLTVPDDPLIDEFALTLGMNLELHRQVLVAFIKGESSYNYQPLLGSPLTITFGDQVMIKQLDNSITITRLEFLDLMFGIDFVYSPIYPIGTVLTLDATLQPASMQAEMSEFNPKCQVVVVAQKTVIDNHFVDYLAYPYPQGLVGDVQPILVGNIAIKAVEVQGPETKLSQEYSEYLKEQLARAGIMALNYQTWRDGELSG